MCDYSLHHVASRPAEVGDKLITTRFDQGLTRGFAALEDPNVAVCLMPGTEIAFDKDVEYDPMFGRGILPSRKTGQRLARFRKVHLERSTHHDALEFSDGKIVLLTNLCGGQHATVLQLPATTKSGTAEEQEEWTHGLNVDGQLFSGVSRL
jgi:hypothetical protein